INLALTLNSLANNLTKCQIWHTAYGLNYKAIKTQFALNAYKPSHKPRRLFRNTNWCSAG
ncbi:hypothetical protein EV356DRAFT_457705, partial [Viridothelium virens]